MCAAKLVYEFIGTQTLAHNNASCMGASDCNACIRLCIHVLMLKAASCMGALDCNARIRL
jgi:hypothetical protein